MEKFYLFIFFLFAAIPCLFTQAYQSMAVEGAHWVMFSDGGHHAFAVRGDTMVDNLAYKKLFYLDLENDPSVPFSSPYLVGEEYLWGVLRDDPQERKVYVIAFELYDPQTGLVDFSYKCPLFQEQVLYDFSATIGDTIADCLGQTNLPSVGLPLGWVVDSIGNEVIYGADRRTLYSNNNNLVPIIYEGVGSRHGLLGGISVWGGCNGEGCGFWLQKYCVGTDAECSIISSNKDIVFPDNQFRLFPNPANQEVQISIVPPITETLEIRIFNVLGQLLLQASIPKGQTNVSISLQDIPSGIYQYILTTDGFERIFRSGSLIRE
jgi:hypothetical protein